MALASRSCMAALAKPSGSHHVVAEDQCTTHSTSTELSVWAMTVIVKRLCCVASVCG